MICLRGGWGCGVRGGGHRDILQELTDNVEFQFYNFHHGHLHPLFLLSYISQIYAVDSCDEGFSLTKYCQHEQ